MSRSFRRLRSRSLIASLVCAVMACVLGVAIGPAQADSLVYQVTNYDNDGTHGVYLRNSANVNDVNKDASHYVTYGTSVRLACWTNGSTVGPKNNTVWDKVTVVSGPNSGRIGYLSEHWVNTPVASNQHVAGEPACSSAPASNPSPSSPPASGSYLKAAQQVRFCVNLSVAGCGASLTGITTPTIGQNTAVTMVCWQDGSTATVGSSSSPRWFWVRAGSTVGFVSAPAVNRQTKVGACSSNKAIWAAETAVQRYGETTARSADLALFSNAEWRPGPVGEWAGDCPKLPYMGWRAAGVSIPKGDAITNYNHYKTIGAIRSGAPPVGAVVFFKVTSLDHEAIALGDGLVVSTQGSDWQGVPNVVRSYGYWGASKYLGWTQPS